MIASGLNPTAATYTWNTSGLAAGTYHIYSQLMAGGRVLNQTYAAWPVVIDHSYTLLPSITLSKSQLNIGATNNGATATSPQDVSVNVTGSVTWSVSSSQPWLKVSPTSGTGNGKFAVSLNSSALPSPPLWMPLSR